MTTKADLFSNSHITGALYFTDLGHYIFKYKDMNSWQTSAEDKVTVTKSLREPEVAAAFSHKGSDSGYLNDGVIRVGNNSKGRWFVFIRKPFRCSFEIIGSGKVTMPAPLLVLVGAANQFSLFALAVKAFNPEAMAFYAPFPNVNSTGWICWGTSNSAPKVDPGKADQVMDLFFKSPFNNDLSGGKSKAFGNDIKLKYPSIEGKDQYPVKDLVKMNRTIDRVIADLIDERR